MKVLNLPCLQDTAEDFFPPTTQALDFPNGLLAWGGQLTPARILAAYRKGIFPWFSEGEPVLWWTPSPRCVLFPDRVYISRRTRRRLRQEKYRLTADSAFEAVIKACAAPQEKRDSTWINADMKNVFIDLHEKYAAHSVEVWLDDQLVGGIYGLAIGHAFFGESMFSRVSDASKIALITLCRQLGHWGFEMIDCQVSNAHLLSMGAEAIGRSEFESRLRKLVSRQRSAQLWTRDFRTNWDW